MTPKPHPNPVNVLKAWLDEPLEDRVMALVEDPSLLELVRDLIEQLEAAEKALRDIMSVVRNIELDPHDPAWRMEEIADKALDSFPATGRTISAVITGDGSGMALPELEDSVGVEPIPRIAGPVLPGASPQDSSQASEPNQDSAPNTGTESEA